MEPLHDFFVLRRALNSRRHRTGLLLAGGLALFAFGLTVGEGAEPPAVPGYHATLEAETQSTNSYGNSLAAAEDYIIVGQPGGSPRSVYLYDVSGDDPVLAEHWQMEHGNFGYAVAVSSSAAAILTPNVGLCEVYERSEDGWHLQTSIDLGSPQYLYSPYKLLSIEDDLLALGMPNHTGEQNKSGMVQIYRRSAGPDGEWGLEGTLEPEVGYEEGLFGSTVLLHEGELFVSRHGGDADNGAVYVYRETNGEWEAVQEVRDDAFGFGGALAAQDQTLIVSAAGAEVDGLTRAGSAVVMERQEDGTWAESQRLSPSPPKEYQRFGLAMTFSAGALVVGSTGALEIFERDPESEELRLSLRMDSDNSEANYGFHNLADAGGRLAVAWREFREVQLFDLVRGDVFVAGVPEESSFHEGEPAVIEADVVGPEEMEFFWTRNGVTVPGANDSKLAFSEPQVEQAGEYVLGLRIGDEETEIFRIPVKIFAHRSELLATKILPTSDVPLRYGEFGREVSVFQDFMAVSAPALRQSGFSNVGAVFLFRRELPGDGWQQVGQLLPEEFQSNVNFGRDMAQAGTTIAVREGQELHVFELIESEPEWTKAASLPVLAVGPMALSNRRLAVVQHDRLVVYERDLSTSEWSEGSEVFIGEAPPGYGSGLAMSGNRIAVGALDDGEGAIHIYEHSYGEWSEKAVIRHEEAGIKFGASFSLLGDRLLVGAPWAAGACGVGGRAFLYEWNAQGGWERTEEFVPQAEECGMEFGRAVAMDGRRIAVASGYEAAPESAGAVHLFEQRDSGWHETGRFFSHGAVGDSSFAENLSFSSGHLVSGGWNDREIGVRGGAAWAFSLAPEPPAVSNHPEQTFAVSGGEAVFEVTATGEDLQYQWYHDGEPIEGATSPRLALQNVSLAEQGAYSVSVENDRGSTRSGSGLLVVDALAVFDEQPVGQEVAYGMPLELHVSARGHPPLLYQWYKDGEAIEGATEGTMREEFFSAESPGVYSVAVSNPVGTVTSEPVACELLYPAPQLEEKIDEPAGAWTTYASGLTASSHTLVAVDAEQKMQILERGTDGNWLEVARHDAVGWGPSLDGDTLAAGNSWGSSIWGYDAGFVSVHERDAGGSSAWAESARFSAPNVWGGDRFGTSVVVRGDYLFAAAHSTRSTDDLSGVVHVFKRDPSHSDGWRPTTELRPDSSAADDRFGSAALAVDGDLLAAANRDGVIFIFRRDPVGEDWTQTETVHPSGDLSWSTRLALSGRFLLATLYDWRGEVPARVLVYELDQEGGIDKSLELPVPPTADPVTFGDRIAVEGGTIAVAQGAGEREQPRELYLYRQIVSDSEWSVFARLQVSEFTHSLSTATLGMALSANRLFVGVAKDDDQSSSDGAISVFALPSGLPTIGQPPLSGEYARGGEARLYVKASGGGLPYAFQWYRDGEPVPGATEPELVLSDLTLADSGAYTVAITNPAGTLWSAAADVTVAEIAPEVVVVERGEDIFMGEGIVLSVEASGSSPMTYQWRLNGRDLTGETGPVLDIADVNGGHAGDYSVRVTNSAGSVEVPVNRIVPRRSAPIPIAYTTDQGLSEGEIALLYARTAGSHPMEYRWFRDGEEIVQGTEDELWIAEASIEDSGSYAVTVSNEEGETSVSLGTLQVDSRPALPFSEGRGTVTVEKYPQFSYWIALPSNYDPDENPLPIVYILHPEVTGYDLLVPVAEELGIVLVAITASRNGVSWREYTDYLYAVMQDVRLRVNFDPTAQFSAGFSGGGWGAFDFSRLHHPQIAGVFSMGGWLGDLYGIRYSFQTGLLVARANGEDDSGANSRLGPDGGFLSLFDPQIRDWSFPGGHTRPPDAVLLECLQWLISSRQVPGPNDHQEAEQAAARWRADISAGRVAAVVQEVLRVLVNEPRTHRARKAQTMMEVAINDFPRFDASLQNGLLGGDYAADYLYYLAHGTGRLGLTASYHSAWRALGWIDDSSGYRLIDRDQLAAAHGSPAERSGEGLSDWLERHELVEDDLSVDFSGDGKSVLLSYAQGGDPWEKSTKQLRLKRDGDDFSIEYRKARELEGVRLLLEQSTDLENWQPISPPWIVSESHADFRQINAQIIPPVSTKSYYRLKITAEE